MSDDPLGNFDDLLDLDIQDHVIEVMNEWCTDTHSALNASRADLVEAQISKPLKFWIDEIFKEGTASNHHVIEAANEFAIKADNIAYILRYKTRSLYPEHVALLNDAWSVFQRSMVYGLHVKNRILKEIIDNPPDLSAAVDEVLRQRHDDVLKIKEERKREKEKTWQVAGANGSIVCKGNRVEVLLMIGAKVIQDKKRHEIDNVTKFAKEIERALNKGNLFYETSLNKRKRLAQGWESIRKLTEIKKLHKDTFNYK